MKRPERLKLVEDIRSHLLGAHPRRIRSPDMELFKKAADCIQQLENELDKIHENFLKDPGQ